MIVTRRWLEEYIDISDISTDDICKTLNSIGLEVDSLEKISIPKGVVVGKVLEKERHPDADKLNVCQVDIGTETVQIVCGAKNVDAGQYVPVATVGCQLSSDFKIKKAKLRGVDSHGMICSTTEIGLAKLNDGILELDNSIGELVIGKQLSEYPLLNDDIIEIELTANRGDCLSINGVARELSAFYNKPLIEKDKILETNDLGIGQVLEVESSNNLDSRFIYIVANLKDYKQPLIQKLRVAILEKYKSSGLEDTLTYIIHSCGVVLNAYAKNDAKFVNNLATIYIEKDVQGFDIVKGNDHLSTICIEHKEINKDKDDEYIIEASYINPEILSKKVFETKRKTAEVYYKSSRGSEPDIELGIECFCTIVSQYGAKIYNGIEAYADQIEKSIIDVNVDKINAIIGQKIEKVTIEKILNSLGFEVKDGVNGLLSIQIPLFRHDIKNIADITEEIVRIIGIDNIEAKPLAIDEVNRVNQTSIDLIKKNTLRTKGVANGFYETLTYVFANKEKLQKYSIPTVQDSLDILNPIVKELDTFRTIITLNLIEACSNNMKLGFKSASFFEIGKIFDINRNEKTVLSLIFSGAKELESVENAGKPANIEFFEFAKKVLNIVGKFDLEPMKKITNDLIHPYQNGSIIVDGEIIGYISKLHPSVADDYDLSDTFFAEIEFDKINSDLVKSKSYSKFQSSRKDLSIIVPKSLEFKEIKKVINEIDDENIKQFNLIDIYSDEKLEDNESLTIRFILQNDTKTLEEEDITSTMNKILENLNSKLGLELRV